MVELTTLPRLVLGLLLALLLTMAPARSENRVALVIGNSAYEHVTPLKNPRNDGVDIANALKRLGFEVVEGFDLTHEQLRQTLRSFSGKLATADVAMFFYAGHALQVNGTNYLVPVDTQLEQEADLDFETVSLDFVMRQMERNAKTLLVFLDACRDNPLTRRLARGTRSTGTGRGLARPESSSEGTIIVFSTEPNNVALDGDGRNSPFTTALLRHIERPGVEISALMTDVRRDVYEATSHQQLPFTNSGLLGHFYFKPTVSGDEPAAVGIAEAERQRLLRFEAEAEAWERIENSNDPKDFADFMQTFGDGPLTSAAELRIELLRLRSERGREGQGASADSEKSDTGVPPSSFAMFGTVPVELDVRGLTIALQAELNRVGCDAGSADGIWGSKSRAALLNYSSHSGTQLAATAPSPELLNRIRSEQTRVCPLVCAARYEAQGDRCILKSCERGMVLDDGGNCMAASPFNGSWQMVRRATVASCGWQQFSNTLTIHQGVVTDGNQFNGTLSPDGTLNFAGRFLHQGRREQNNYTGQLRGTNGQGTFRHAGGSCRGTFTISKLN